MKSVRGAIALSLAQCAAAIAAAVLLGDGGSWKPEIFFFLLGFALIGDRLEVETRVLTISGAFLAIALAMVMLGPVPAMAIGMITTTADALQRRPRVPYVVSNVATFLAFPMVGGGLVKLLGDGTGLGPEDMNFALLVIGSFIVANVVNFVQVAVTHKLIDAKPFWRSARSIYLPILPSQFAVALLAAVIVYAHAHGGGVALVLLVGVVVLYQYLLRELLLSKERAEQLGTRTTQLASLQVGVLTAMLQTLSLRDKMTARHCAAVARYAKEIAKEYGMDDEEQDLVHTAGLLHDIGKFIFPDSILLGGNKLTDEEYEIVKKHPAQGAKVVRGVDGYGPVADIILAHHEKIDGKGYPNGIKGDDIPIQSRMISVADTYDVMTARDSYREPVSPAEAVAELRRVSGTQLDGNLVEMFIKILERKGVNFHHGDDADFESELDLERRIRKYAEPRAAATV
ncbi:MAG: HD-GYP domain-containing protein [Solirubrobacteraceae bacterium]